MTEFYVFKELSPIITVSKWGGRKVDEVKLRRKIRKITPKCLKPLSTGFSLSTLPSIALFLHHITKLYSSLSPSRTISSSVSKLSPNSLSLSPSISLIFEVNKEETV